MPLWCVLTWTSDNVHGAIEQWYWAPDAIAEKKGDVPMAPFSFVRCIEVKNGTTHHQHDMTEENPYECAFYLFYDIDYHLRMIRLYGGITWERLFRRHGHVNLNEDLVQNRCFVVPWEEEEHPVPMPNLRWFPLMDDRYFKPTFPHKATGLLYDFIAIRLEVYFGKRSMPSSMSPEEDVLSCLYLGAAVNSFEHQYHYPGHPVLDKDKQRTRFVNDRLRTEQEHFFGWIQPFTATEDNMLQLLIHNGLAENRLVYAKTLDLQTFFLRHPGWKPPTFVVEVFLEDVPLEWASSFPIHHGRRVHLSYRDVAPWIWQRFLAQGQRMAFDRDPFEDSFMEKVVMYRILEHYALGGGVFVGIQQTQQQQQQQQQPQPPGVIHMTDFTVPPCLQQVMEAPQFPKHLQRLVLLWTLKAAGATRDSVAQWFETKNAQYPSTYTTAKARFDYDRAWDRPNTRPGYCVTFVKNALAGKADTITCPFAARSEWTQDIEDIVSKSKARCRPHAPLFSGPVHWMETKQPPLPPLSSCNDDSSSSSSSSESEEFY